MLKMIHHMVKASAVVKPMVELDSRTTNGFNPTEDLNGDFADNCQTYDNVYFLCGTTRTMNNVKRKCDIPDDKLNFLPVICYEHSLLEDKYVKDPQELLGLSTNDLNDYDIKDISAKMGGKDYNTTNGHHTNKVTALQDDPTQK